MILFIERENVGDFADAWAAPRRPEVDENDLAAIRLPIDLRLIKIEAFDLHLVSDEAVEANLSFESRRNVLAHSVF